MASYIPKRPKTTNIFFYFLLTILAVFVLFNFTELKNDLVVFKEIKPIWFICAVIAQILTYILVMNIYTDLLNLYGQRSSIPRKQLFGASLVTLLLSQIVPIGGFSGQGYLVHFLQKRKMPSHVGLTIAILETFTYCFAHLIFSLFTVVCLIIIFKSLASGFLLLVAIFGVIIFLAEGSIILLFARKKTMLSFESKIEKHKWLNWLFNKIKLEFPKKEILNEEWKGIWWIIRKKSLSLLRPLFWQIMIILADVATIFLLFSGFGFKIKFFVVLWGMVLTKAVVMISISPGALVFFEGAMVLFYTAFGIPVHLVLIIALFFRGLSFWLPMPFGLYFYKRLASVRNNLSNNE